MSAAIYMPFATRSRRTFDQALRKAGLEAPAFRKDTEQYRQQAGLLMLDLIVLGVDHRFVGGYRFYCWPLDGAPEGREPL
jgi:hypothetical protein